MRQAIALILLAALGGATGWAAEAKDRITVKVIGTLNTGVVAIGAETTGTTITSKEITWELEFGEKQALRERAEQLNGEKVLVEGTLERRRGVELAERWIVTVSKLDVPSAAAEQRRPAGQGAIEVHEPSEHAELRVHEEPDAVRIDVHCERGIGQATLARRTEQWPAVVRVRLYLKGLESFRAASGSTSVEWSAGSGEEGSGRVAIRQASTERPLDPSSPYWTPICITRADDTPDEDEGFFEIPLPARLFEANPDAVDISWIDFYRG